MSDLFFVYCKQRSKRAQKVPLLWTKHLPPISLLVSLAGSLACQSICSFPFVWRAWHWDRSFLSFAAAWRVSCCHQGCLLHFAAPDCFLSRSDGLVTKQSHGWGLCVGFLMKQGNIPRDAWGTNTLLVGKAVQWGHKLWSSSRKWAASFFCITFNFFWYVYLYVSEDDVLDKFLKITFKRIVFKALSCRVGDTSVMKHVFGMNRAMNKIFLLKKCLIYMK